MGLIYQVKSCRMFFCKNISAHLLFGILWQPTVTWALQPLESVEIFLFLEACHHSVNKQSGSTLPDLSIPELGTDFARGQKYVCCCRYSIWSYISHLFEFIGLCLHFYSISTFRGCWSISTLYLSFKMWTNLKLIPAADRLSWCFFSP